MTRRFLQLAVLAAIAIAMLAAPAAGVFAQTAPENQTALEKIFTDMLADYSKAAEESGHTLVSEGKIMVEPSGSYYAVTLPHLTLKAPDGTYTEIGMIAVNAQPGENQDIWKITMALPTPIVQYGADKKPVVSVALGGQNFSGVWHNKFRIYTRLSAQYRDIAIKQFAPDGGEQPVMTLTAGGGRVLFDLKETAPDLWSGPIDFSLQDITVKTPADGAVSRIAEIAVKSSMEDYSFAAALDYEEKIRALGENYGQDKEAEASTAHVIGLYNLVFDFLSAAWSKFDSTFSVKGLDMTRPPIPGSEAGSLKLAAGTLGFGMSGFRTGIVSTSLRLDYSGFSFSPQPQHLNGALPESATINLGINNLPYKELVDLGRSSIQAAGATSQGSGMVALQAIAAVPQLLTQAKTNLTLNPSAIGNTNYDFKGQAQATADMNAVMGATANAKIEVFGLDYLIEKLNAVVADPSADDESKKSLGDTLAALTFLKMAGQMGKDAAGREIRSYDIQLNQQGQTLLNGTDLKMLMPKKGEAPAVTP